VRLELTKRADYALRAMFALAATSEDVLSGARIASLMGIPPRYVAQVMGDLVRAGLTEARNGRNGGYRLSQSADTISLLDIIKASECRPGREQCSLRDAPCSEEGSCAIHPVLSAARRALLDRLQSTTLAAARETDSRQGDGLAWPTPRSAGQD
jgi:Rrf2 family protein